jgi:DNA-binding SARP family transcriptional activator
MAGVELSLLGSFVLTIGGRVVPVLPTAQRLIAYLAVQSRPAHRPRVAAVLWPDTPPSRAGANLRSALWRTQRLCLHLIAADAQHLMLDPGVVVDLRRGQRLADRLLDSGRDCADILHAGARADLAEDLLPAWADEGWLAVEREHFRQLRLHALEAMGDRLIAAGRPGEAVAAGLAAVAAEPLRESAHRAVIRAHLAAGNRWAAARQYELCRRVFREDLGLSPSAELRQLARGAGEIDNVARDRRAAASFGH